MLGSKINENNWSKLVLHNKLSVQTSKSRKIISFFIIHDWFLAAIVISWAGQEPHANVVFKNLSLTTKDATEFALNF